MTAGGAGTPATEPVWRRGAAFWDGRWAATTETDDVVDPEHGALLGRAARCTPEIVDTAVTAVAAATHDGPTWPGWQRREALDLAARMLHQRREEFAALISQESSKPITSARAEVARAVETLQLSAALPATISGETLPSDATQRGAGRIASSRPDHSAAGCMRGRRSAGASAMSPGSSIWGSAPLPRSRVRTHIAPRELTATPVSGWPG